MLNSHIHLDFNNLADNGSIVPSIGKQNWSKVINYKNFALGIHPWFSNSHNEADLIKLGSLIKNYNAIAIGECGLDYSIKIPKNIQQKIFIHQLELAQKFKLPIIIHAVKCYDDIYNILKKYNLKVQIHGFNGSPKQADNFLQIGCYLSFGLYKKSNKLQEFIKTIALNKILLETDEKPHSLLIDIASEISILKQISALEMIKNM